MWLTDKGCSDIVEVVWSINSTATWDTHVLRKMESCGAALTKWSKKSVGSVKKQLESAHKRLKAVEKYTIRFGDSSHMRLLEDEDIKEWKVNVIDILFYDFEVAIIKNMPLCRSIQDDVLIWPFNLDGVYSVKSGYRYLHEQQQHGLPRPSDNLVLTPLWKKIWGLQVPNKVKHLAWKACKDSLPTKTNLIRRKVITEGYCDVCKLHQEDVVHTLFLCPALQPVWRSRNQWNHSTLQACSSFTDIFELIFAGNRELDLFATMLWTLWNRRNNLRLGKPALSISQVVGFAQDRILEQASCSIGFHQPRPHQI
nr:putative ribonuclease h protein [Quercus suber]